MLKPEEIQKQLETIKNIKPWVEARIERLRDANPMVREIGMLLMGRDPSGKEEDPEALRLHWHRGAERLRELSADQLVRLGESLFPQFVDVFRAAWDMHAHLPIQVGYARKPFRAPNRAELILEVRRQFLFSLLQSMAGYDQDLPWIAAHAGHIGQYRGAEQLGVLLAAAINLGGERARQIEQILRDSAAGTHEIGQFGRHVAAAMLCSSKPENWEFIEKMLLAAQRQEGLRQAILESIDFSHPDAFRRMLRVINENNLVRFSATVRAANVWLGLQLDSASAKYIEETLHTIADFLDDPAKREIAIAGDDAEKAFFALWSVAFDDAPTAVAPAGGLLSHPKPEMRFIALHLIDMLGLPETSKPVLEAVEDSDLRIAAYATGIASMWLQGRMRDQEVTASATHAIAGIPRARHVRIPPKESGDLFERLCRLHARTPEKAKVLKPLVWPWLTVRTDRESVADSMVVALGQRPPARLLPYLADMSPNGRRWTADLLGIQPKLDIDSRRSLLELVGDASHAVRDAAVDAMRRAKISVDNLGMLEPLLARKASDLRRGVLGLILSVDDAAALTSAERLVGSKNLSQRLAGLDLLTQLGDARRSAEKVRTIAESFKASRPIFDRDEQVYVDKLLSGSQVTITLDDALGLMDPAKRTPPTQPLKRHVNFCTSATVELLKSLDELVHEHREDVVMIKTYGGETQQQPLGGMRYGFPSVHGRSWEKRDSSSSWKQPLAELPLSQLWFDWWHNRSVSSRDADGVEAARAVFVISTRHDYRSRQDKDWRDQILQDLIGDKAPKIRYEGVVHSVLQWIVAHETPKRLADFSVDGFETLMAAIPGDKLTVKGQYADYAFREFLQMCIGIQGLGQMAKNEGQWTREHTGRMFGLQRWADEPAPNISRRRPDWVAEMIPAFEAGFANENDLMDSLLGPRPVERYSRISFNAVSLGSAALRRGELPPKVAAMVQRTIDRILEIELIRGETETAATPAALELKYAGGSAVLIRVLQAIGSDPKLQRNYSWGEASKGKSVVFSHLIRATFPDKEESPEAFSRSVTTASIDEDALLAVAFYAPQWARFIQAAVGWPMMEEAVWWIHAHTKDTSWRIDRDTREGWNAEVRKLTPLTLEDLVEGAVDVEWFHRTHEALGQKRWNRLDDFAKYASGGGGHKRAQLFAAAMLGKVKRTQLGQEISGKRKQDAVRALGLIPVDNKTAKQDVLKRYQIMQEFVRGSRQFGSQRQASEKLAARIGQENLARTAGYPDPIRLQWAMEGLASADLAKGPVTCKVKDISVTLAIDADGLPEITVARKDKPLKAIPPEAKKNPKVEDLLERKTDLRRSASRMRQSLELAMCRGDRFGREELIELMGNVVLSPMLERLVFVGEGITGYPVGGGKGLRDHAGKIEPVKKNEVLRLAHPVDLLRLKQWTQWQRDCFAAERVQPFKQVFRELYVLTDQEKSDSTFSRRYAGQQINPRQAMALLGSRGWVTAPEAGVFRTFHDEKLVAWVEFMEPFYTPAEVEGLTLEKIRFAPRGGREYAKLADLPPRLFSEVMRDADLVVSVAHRGAVDPEASASTVELRASLLRETLRLLKIVNVKIKEPHIHIKGSLAEYSVHLGSATTHMLPGGTLFIVPVHSQHRGRIFLPFADDDPKTAEIISKVMLLARDQELKDPNLLDQIRTRSM